MRKLVSLPSKRWFAAQTLTHAKRWRTAGSTRLTKLCSTLSFFVMKSNIFDVLQTLYVYPPCKNVWRRHISEKSTDLFVSNHGSGRGGSTGRDQARTERVQLRPKWLQQAGSSTERIRLKLDQNSSRDAEAVILQSATNLLELWMVAHARDMCVIWSDPGTPDDEKPSLSRAYVCKRGVNFDGFATVLVTSCQIACSCGAARDVPR